MKYIMLRSSDLRFSKQAINIENDAEKMTEAEYNLIMYLSKQRTHTPHTHFQNVKFKYLNI